MTCRYLIGSAGCCKPGTMRTCASTGRFVPGSVLYAAVCAGECAAFCRRRSACGKARPSHLLATRVCRKQEFLAGACCATHRLCACSPCAPCAWQQRKGLIGLLKLYCGVMWQMCMWVKRTRLHVSMLWPAAVFERGRALLLHGEEPATAFFVSTQQLQQCIRCCTLIITAQLSSLFNWRAAAAACIILLWRRQADDRQPDPEGLRAGVAIAVRNTCQQGLETYA